MADRSKASARISASIMRQLDSDSNVEDDGKDPSRPAGATTSASIVSGMQELQARLGAASSSSAARNADIVNRALGLGRRSWAPTAKPVVMAAPTTKEDTPSNAPGANKRKMHPVSRSVHHQHAVVSQKTVSDERGIIKSQKLTLMPRGRSQFEMMESSSSEHSACLDRKGIARARRKPIAKRQQYALSETEESEPDTSPLPKQRAAPRMISKSENTFDYDAGKTTLPAPPKHKEKRTQGSSDDEDEVVSALRRKVTRAAFQFVEEEWTSKGKGGKKVALHLLRPGSNVCGRPLTSEKRKPATHRRIVRSSRDLVEPSTQKRSKSEHGSDSNGGQRREYAESTFREMGHQAGVLALNMSSDYSYVEDDDDESSSSREGWGHGASHRDISQRTRRLNVAHLSDSSDFGDAEDALYPIQENHPVDDGTTEPLELSVDGRRAKLPASIARYLFNHQKVGVKWLYEQYAKRIGGILAGAYYRAVQLLSKVLLRRRYGPRKDVANSRFNRGAPGINRFKSRRFPTQEGSHETS